MSEETEETAIVAEMSTDMRRIYPHMNCSDRDGIAFDVNNDSPLTSNLSALDVLKIFDKGWRRRRGGWPRMLQMETKAGLRTMIDLGPWWECDDCKKKIVEFEQRGKCWRSASGRRYCEECVLKIKITEARKKDAAWKEKRQRKSEPTTMKSLLPFGDQ